MKIKLLDIILIIFAGFVISGYAQESNKIDSDIKWTRIETAEKDLSVALPPNFIVDAEKREFGQRYKIVGFQNDVRMEITVYKDRNSSQRFQTMRQPNGMNFSTFEKNGIKGVRLSSIDTAQIYKEKIFFLNGDTSYVLSLEANDKTKSEVKRFLFSIKLNGADLFTVPPDKKHSEESALISSLKTSPEVIEAFEREAEKKKPNVTTEISSMTENNFISYENYSRPPIILDRPYPRFNPPLNPVAGIKSFSVKLKLKLLADGQIGDITILSIGDKNFTNACVEIARKIKFIPARIKDVNADSIIVVDYSMDTFTVTTTTNTILPGKKTF